MSTVRAVDDTSASRSASEASASRSVGDASAAKPAGTVTGSDVETQLQQIRDDIAALAKTVAAYGATKAEDAKARVGQVANTAVEAGQNALDSVQSQVATLEKDLSKQVREKPLQALGIAAAAGFLLSVVARR